jgi:hypothetical protein
MGKTRDTTQGTTENQGRQFVASAYGNTEEELEKDALSKARGFFGPDARLEINRTYSVYSSKYGHKYYHAAVTVAELREDS